MELPEDVLRIIHDFTRPVTRSNWRTLHKFTQSDLTNEILSIDRIYLEPKCFVIQFKNILFIFDHHIFSVFRYIDYLIESF